MSHYLVERIGQLTNVEVVTGVEVSAIDGADRQLEAIRWRELSTGAETQKPVAQLFSFIGADPNTDWLRTSGLQLDSRGFRCPGTDAGADRLSLETRRCGVFVVGGVRAGPVETVAAAGGAGAQKRA